MTTVLMVTGFDPYFKTPPKFDFVGRVSLVITRHCFANRILLKKTVYLVKERIRSQRFMETLRGTYRINMELDENLFRNESSD